MRTDKILALLLGFVGAAAYAHEQVERRDVVLILAPDRIQLMVGYSLPAGLEAAEIRALIDADRSGAIDAPTEELARATLLRPRIEAGLGVTIDGQPVALTLADLAWREGPGDPGPRQGFTGLALYAGTWEGSGEARIELSVSGGSPVSAEIQLDPGMGLVDSAVPIAPDTGILGPVQVLPDLPMVVQVRLAEVEDGTGTP